MTKIQRPQIPGRAEAHRDMTERDDIATVKIGGLTDQNAIDLGAVRTPKIANMKLPARRPANLRMRVAHTHVLNLNVALRIAPNDDTRLRDDILTSRKIRGNHDKTRPRTRRDFHHFVGIGLLTRIRLALILNVKPVIANPNLISRAQLRRPVYLTRIDLDPITGRHRLDKHAL